MFYHWKLDQEEIAVLRLHILFQHLGEIALQLKMTSSIIRHLSAPPSQRLHTFLNFPSTGSAFTALGSSTKLPFLDASGGEQGQQGWEDEWAPHDGLKAQISLGPEETEVG